MNCQPGQTARVTEDGPNYGKVFKILGPHPWAKGYRLPDGSIRACHIWQVDPPIQGWDGKFYDAVADEHLLPLIEA